MWRKSVQVISNMTVGIPADKVSLFQGTLPGLLIGLAQLNCSEPRLKRLCCRSGLLAIDRVINYALSEWLAGIKGTQLSRILGGVGPVHSFLQLFQGLVDLVWLPIDQYRRDGRVMRGRAAEGRQLIHHFISYGLP